MHDLLPEGCFIWRHTPGEMAVKRVAFLGVERGHVRLNREELLERIVEEFHGGPARSAFPPPGTRPRKPSSPRWTPTS